MARISLLLLLVALVVAVASAGAPTFCKCTCFKNSTIIPLGPNQPGAPASPPSSTKPGRRDHHPLHIGTRAPSPSCSQCNRAACLSYNLPFCADAEEKDVVAMCFQRDSQKDQFIVWGFILGTTGLLGWAALKRVGEMKGVTGGLGGLAGGRVGRAVAGLGIGGGGQGQQAGGHVGGLFQRRGTGEQAEGLRGAYSPVGAS